MTSRLLKKHPIIVSPITVLRAGISLAITIACGGLISAQQPPSVSKSVERTLYFQKPAEGVVPAQAIAPPAPPPRFQPLSMPNLNSTPAAVSPDGLGTPVPTLQVPAATAPTQAITKPFITNQQINQTQTQPPSTSAAIQDAVQNIDVKPITTPKREEVFRFDSEEALQNRIRKEAPGNNPVFFPPTAPTANVKQYSRNMPSMQVLIEPAYVVHHRLFFEDKNAERAGWDIGPAQPIASALLFYKDCALLPAKIASNFMEPYDTSAGKCLAGCPTPLLWYPPEITLFGGTVGAAAIVGMAAVFP